MKKEMTVEELNKKINKIEKFKTKGIPVLNRITCTLIGVTIATMFIVVILQAGAPFLIGTTSLLLAAACANTIAISTNYDKKIKECKNQIRKLEGKKSEAKTATVTKKVNKEKLVVKTESKKAKIGVTHSKKSGASKTDSKKIEPKDEAVKPNNNQGYSRTKAMKIYAEKSKAQNEEIQNSLN